MANFTEMEMQTVRRFLSEMEDQANQLRDSAHGDPGALNQARRMDLAVDEAEQFLDLVYDHWLGY